MFDDNKVDVGGVLDRRGRGMGMPVALGGGGGIVGLLVLLAVQFLGGGDLAALVPNQVGMGAGGESTEELRARCNAEGAIDQHDDCYVIKSYNEVNEVWAAQIQDYRPPSLVFFEQATSTGCGNATAEVGPFYCPPDEGVYFDLGFLRQLQQQFGAEGRYAQTYIVAHEVGHHLQNITGISARAEAASNRGNTQAISIGIELQADCFAGAWSAIANRQGNLAITERELDQALNAAAAVGDDRVQQRTSGRVDPEKWTHGSAQQRRDAFLTGYRSANAQGCANLVPTG